MLLPNHLTSRVLMDEYQIKLPQSILWKLSAFLVLAIFSAGIIQLIFSTKGWRDLVEEVEQQGNWNVAAEFALRIQPLVKDHLNQQELERFLATLTILHPRNEFLLLSADGEIVSSVPYRNDLVRKKIDTTPLRKALEPISPQLPIYADDPFSDKDRKIFSVAPIVIEGKDGFLYMPLMSASFELLVRKTGQFYLINSVLLGILISTIASITVGLLLSRHLRKRFLAMTSAISAFEAGDYSQRAKDDSKDEIGDLSRSFNRMAETIVGNVEELKRKDRLRRELIANISHDLRGPVTSIIGYVETMLHSATNEEEQREYLSIIHENAQSQQDMVDDLFHLASLEANESKPRKDFSSLQHILKNVVESQKPSAEKKSQTLLLEVPAELPMVYVDPAMIQRVLNNLVSNSIRYTPKGGTISVAAQTHSDKVLCWVADNGIGIPEDELPFVFDSFFRANQHRPEDPGGTGLGLAIVKKLLLLHGTDPQIESTVGVGTKTSFLLSTQET